MPLRAHLTGALLLAGVSSFHQRPSPLHRPKQQQLPSTLVLHAVDGPTILQEALSEERPTTAPLLSADASLPPPWSRTLSMSCDAPLLYGEFFEWQKRLLLTQQGGTQEEVWRDERDDDDQTGGEGNHDRRHSKRRSSSSSSRTPLLGLGGREIPLRKDLALKVGGVHTSDCVRSSSLYVPYIRKSSGADMVH
jgi:hypothetical protein